MNTTLHKISCMMLITIVLIMSFFYACVEATDSSEDSPPAPTLQAGDITYDNIAQDAPGTVSPQSSKISSFSGLTFELSSISTHTGTQVRPAIAEDGTITTAADTSAGSYQVTITPDGRTILGDPFTVDFYVTITATSTADLDTKLKTAIANYGSTGDFNYIDTSAVTHMADLFVSDKDVLGGVERDRTYVANFNGDISKWNVSAVETFAGMFQSAAAFNQDIGGWDVSSVTDFSWMFKGATVFNQNIGKWNVSSGKNFNSMFYGAAAFNNDGSPDIGDWVVSIGTDFTSMFQGATAFNQDLSTWIVTTTATTTDMFTGSGVDNPESYTWYP